MNNRRVVFLTLSVTLCVIALAVLLFLVGEPARAQSATRYVATTGTDSGGCTDPNNPCRTVQYAVDVAGEGNAIKVATGVYNNINSYGGLAQVVYISKTVTIRGGYTAPAYTEPRHPEANATTLDAGGQGRVLFIVGEISPTIEGLNMTGGRSGDPTQESGYGGGLYIVTATVTLSDCVVQNNEALPLYTEYTERQSFPLEGGQGGGLYLQHGDALLIRSTVRANRSWYGGGLYVDQGHTTLLSSTVQSNTAMASTALGTSGRGGGLYLFASHASLISNTVQHNVAAGVGGGLYLLASNAVLVNNTVQSNSAAGSAGGKGHGMAGGLYLESSHARLVGNAVQDNGSVSSGGGLYLSNSTGIFTNNLVTGNYIHGGRYWPDGGGSGLRLDGSSARLTNNIIQSNQSQNAACGAICLSSSNIILTNTIIADNLSGVAKGAGLSLGYSSATIRHTTIARNTGGDGSGIHVANGSTVALTNTILVSQTTGITVSAGNTAILEATLWGVDLWANGTDWGGDGAILTGTTNVWGNPAFVDPETGDYHIGPGSAAVNTGIDAGVDEDMDGEPRPAGAGYDLGADEVWYKIYLPLVIRNHKP